MNTVYDMEEGMHYVCQRCGNCCRWPGEVPVSEEEIAQIAAYLGISEQEMIDQYTEIRRNRAGLTLISRPNHECIFLEGNECRIHPVKPEQCKNFPNGWNFPGWRNVCEAIPVPKDSLKGATEVKPQQKSEK